MKPLVRKQIGVIVAGTCSSETRALAEAVGKEIAKRELFFSVEALGE